MCTHYSIKTENGKYISFVWNRFYASYDLELHDNLGFEIKGLIFENEESAFYELNSYINDDYHYRWLNDSYEYIDKNKAELTVVGLNVEIKEVKEFTT